MIIMIIIEHAILDTHPSLLSYFLLGLCVELDDMYLFYLTVCCMTTLLMYDYMRCLPMWVTHLSPYLQLLVSVISFISTLTFASLRSCVCLFL